MGDSDPAATYGHVARECRARGIAFLFLREKTGEKDRLTPRLKEIFGGPVIANDSLTPEDGERLLSTGEADAVSYGRPFIANPDLVERFAKRAPLNEPDPSTFYGGGREGYLDYPTLDEATAAA